MDAMSKKEKEEKTEEEKKRRRRSNWRKTAGTVLGCVHGCKVRGFQRARVICVKNIEQALELVL